MGSGAVSGGGFWKGVLPKNARAQWEHWGKRLGMWAILYRIACLLCYQKYRVIRLLEQSQCACFICLKLGTVNHGYIKMNKALIKGLHLPIQKTSDYCELCSKLTAQVPSARVGNPKASSICHKWDHAWKSSWIQRKEKKQKFLHIGLCTVIWVSSTMYRENTFEQQSREEMLSHPCF